MFAPDACAATSTPRRRRPAARLPQHVQLQVARQARLRVGIVVEGEEEEARLQGRGLLLVRPAPCLRRCRGHSATTTHKTTAPQGQGATRVRGGVIGSP